MGHSTESTIPWLVPATCEGRDERMDMGKMLWARSASTRKARRDTCYSPWNRLQMVPKLPRDTSLSHSTNKEKPSAISPRKSRHLYQYKGICSGEPRHTQHRDAEWIHPRQSLTKPNHGHFERNREKCESDDGNQEGRIQQPPSACSQAIWTYLREPCNSLPLDDPPWLPVSANSQRVLRRWPRTTGHNTI